MCVLCRYWNVPDGEIDALDPKEFNELLEEVYTEHTELMEHILSLHMISLAANPISPIHSMMVLRTIIALTFHTARIYEQENFRLAEFENFLNQEEE